MVRFVQALEDVSMAKRMLQGILAEQVLVVLDNVWDGDIIKHFNIENVRRSRAFPFPDTISPYLGYRVETVFGRWAIQEANLLCIPALHGQMSSLR
jgi:hypothetical protein